MVTLRRYSILNSSGANLGASKKVVTALAVSKKNPDFMEFFFKIIQRSAMLEDSAYEERRECPPSVQCYGMYGRVEGE